MGKLVDESVNEFLELLDTIKQKMNQIFIIEHNHHINYDYLINVTKNDNDVSSLEIE